MPHGLESITSDDQHLQITLSMILTNFFCRWLALSETLAVTTNTNLIKNLEGW